jgi:SNF2 family DNA or RNA helicase
MGNMYKNLACEGRMQLETQSQILNFRKMKHDFSNNALKEGKVLFDKGAVTQAKISELTPKMIKVEAKVLSQFSKEFTCEFEIERFESEIFHSSCNCPNHSDCQHLACLLFFLEKEIEQLIVSYSDEQKKKINSYVSPKAQVEVDEIVRSAEKKVVAKKEKEREKQLVEEYLAAASMLGKFAFFVPEEELAKDVAELSLILIPVEGSSLKQFEVQLVLRLPSRPKPFYIQQPKQFLTSIYTQEPLSLGGKRYIFGMDSFGPLTEELMKTLRQHMQFSEPKGEKGFRIVLVDREGFGELLACAYEFAIKHKEVRCEHAQKQEFSLQTLFWLSLDTPLCFSEQKAEIAIELEHLSEPYPHLLLAPTLNLGSRAQVALKDALLFECSLPGVFGDNRYYRFSPEINRQHIHEIDSIQKMTIPEALIGSFVENALPELTRYAKVTGQEVLESYATYPFPNQVKAECALHYANGELEAGLHFLYGKMRIPETSHEWTSSLMKGFVTKEGILARNLVEENALIRDLFQGFIKDEKSGAFVAKTEKKIVEFMTETIPQFQKKVQFSCPEVLQSQFCYDNTQFTLSLSEGKTFDRIRVDFSVDGALKGLVVDYLWDCVSNRKTFIVVTKKDGKAVKEEGQALASHNKILVLQLDTLQSALQIFDELQIKKLDNITFELPLWVLVNLLPSRFENHIITLKLSKRLKEIQEQIFDMSKCEAPPLPKSVKATLRNYQEEGVRWLARLRSMGLNGILADDMGLGKTVQAICAITQYIEKRKSAKQDCPGTSLIVCPTSLVENWKEEFHQFNPSVRVATCAGTPNERKKLLSNPDEYDVIVTSYGLAQKDIELYEKMNFGYLLLDEAQYIKNRETSNAKTVKKIPSRHKLILTGTPLENSLEDLWSLFDFLMPGLLGSFDRFVSTYVRRPAGTASVLESLRKKITPFVMRRMKQDVLKDLPPISHIVYHCSLSPTQKDLYYSYAKTAKEQLVKLVEKEGFDKVRLHVLATLTRLKQICCHPAIFAKDSVEAGDSAKYEMLVDLLGGLVESKHKTVIFSQYTQMLSIMKQDLKKLGTQIAYLDGSSKNRLSIVKQFNEDPNTLIFLVSLKAGGNGLNLTSADTVIHYDMWWNPAVENQATDRVWRFGQKQQVSSYKLVTLGTIEEKIVELQDKKRELVKDIVRTDDEIISKLTWDEVLELLKT